MAAIRTITYGTFTCKYTRLTTQSTNVYDGLHYIGTDVTHTINGVIATEDEETFAANVKSFNTAFSKPRQQFKVVVDAAVLYDVKYDETIPLDNSKDIRFGPNVESYNIDSYLGRIASSVRTGATI